MSEDATNTSKRPMDCGRVAREEILESYLAGRLTEQDREAFEEHYFECARCFDELRMLQTIRDVLPGATRESESNWTHGVTRWAPAVGLAAAVVLTVGMVLLMRLSSSSNPPEPTKSASPSEVQIPGAPNRPQPEPATTPELSFEQLARVDPPRYEPVKLRGAPDEATQRFVRGMEHYRKADYAGAVEGLRAAAELDPDAPEIRFFLGVSHLMLRQDDAAIDRLRATIALGDSAYLEEAHWYLAKALLRRKDVGATETQLKTVIQLRGPKSGEARQLLTAVERLKGRSP
jgi:hypothetical protein